MIWRQWLSGVFESSKILRLTPMRPFPVAFLVVTIMVLSGLTSPAIGQSSTLVGQEVMAACEFLISLYNPALQLVRTTPSTNLYYIASDNLLAKKAVAYCNTAIGQNITQSISTCCGAGNDYMHESLLGQKIPLPIHNGTVYRLANSSAGTLFRNISTTAAGGSYTVLWEVHNSTGILSDCFYGDVAVYSGLEMKLENNVTGVQHEMGCLNVMFDGYGVADEAYKDGSVSEHGIYQTYKLALYIYALWKVSNTFDYRAEEDLLRMQGPDGGFHTGYDRAGTYAGTMENAETTSISILALNSTSTFRIFPRVAFPSWIVYAFIGLPVAGVAAVVIVIMLERRKPKLTQQ